LHTLEIRDCGLKTICREDLKEFTNIEQLFLGHNELTTLPDDLLEDMTKLTAISFYNNKIEKMSSNLLKPIRNNKLTSVDFRKNTKIDAYYFPKDFEGLSSIKKLMRIIDREFGNPDSYEASTSVQDQPAKDFQPESSRNANKVFEDLWNSRKCSDFAIAVNKSILFRVHKCILAVQSEVFAKLFEDDPNAIEMKVDDLNPEAVEGFLQYFYLGRLKNSACQPFQVFALASKFKVFGLIKMMEESILNQLTDSNALKVFSLAHSFESADLKQAAFKKIQQTMPGISLSDSLINDLPKVKQLIEAKEKLDSVLKSIENILK
jgi:hypothetical protein